jgi:hypothetical protein
MIVKASVQFRRPPLWRVRARSESRGTPQKGMKIRLQGQPVEIWSLLQRRARLSPGKNCKRTFGLPTRLWTSERGLNNARRGG